MKRFALAAIVLFMTATMGAQTQAPKINFETKSHDFGTIKETDGKVTYVFQFTNIGNEPLNIVKVKASCGCTTPTWTKKPVLPGDSGQISVTYNPRNRPGSFRKSVTVTANTEPANTYLSIKGKVIQREKTVEEKYPFTIGTLRAKKTSLSFFNMTDAEEKTESYKVVNTTEKDITLTFSDLPKHITAPDQIVIPAGKEGTIDFSYDASEQDDWGFVSDKIYCVVNGEKSKTAIKLSATITKDFSKLSKKDLEKAPKAKISTQKIDFGSVTRGENVVKTFEVTNNGKNDLIIYAAKSTSSIVSCKVSDEKVKTGQSTTIEVTLDTSRTKGRQYKSINIITNDPSKPNITFTLTGTVK